jgi:PHD/YefM family antitoxin component YafN of YafNO toxin-antitoxin module
LTIRTSNSTIDDMDNFISTTTYTASEARENLYKMIEKASGGLEAFEITHRGGKPVIMMSKDELMSWLETIEIMQNPAEMIAIKAWKKDKKTISHKEMLRKLKTKE